MSQSSKQKLKLPRKSDMALLLFFAFSLFFGSLWWLQESSISLAPTSDTCHPQMTDEEAASARGITVATVQKLHRGRSLTNEEICLIPQSKLDRAIFRVNTPKPDHPGEAASFRALQTGEIPPDGYSAAAAQIEKMQMAQAQNSRLASAGINAGNWTSIGPGNVGGRIRSIVIHPTTTDTMWVGSVSGGIWKTVDGGVSWQPEDDFMANLAVSTMVIDPTDPDTMYAGTGEGFYNGHAIQGAGVFKTTDGGVNWSQLASTATSSWHYVNRLAIAPDSSAILAATSSGIYRSTDGGVSWISTGTGGMLDVDFHPTNANLSIASGYGGATLYSTNNGATWLTASGISGDRVEVAYALSNPTTVFASVDVNNGEIWRSTDGGQTYSLMNTGDAFLGGQGWYDNIVWVDPTDADTVIVGGIDLWRSTDGGSTLTKISEWYNSPVSAHADHHAIVAHPNFDGNNNKTVFFGNDGGIYKAEDVYTVVGTTGWQELNNELGITQFYGAAGNPTSGVIVGGTQDNGTLRYTGDSETWSKMNGGDGGFAAADPTDPNYFYGEYIYLQIHRSSNGGASASDIDTGIGDARNRNTANFIAPFILDPNDASRMLAGGVSLWRTNDVKAGTPPGSFPTWVAIKPSIGSKISAIAVADGNPDIIWVGHNDGSVYMTSNGTAVTPTWTQVDTNTPNLPNRYAMRITIDPTNHNIVYATFGGFTGDNIWRTTDGGSTWTDVTGSGATGLPNVPVRSLVIHPDHANWLYVGTEVGIFTSEDAGATWTVPHEGPSNVSVDELFWIDRTLVAATHGRGLFMVDTDPLRIEQTAVPDPVDDGEDLTYTLTAENNINVALNNVVITSTVPAGTTYVANSASDGGTESGGIVTFPAVSLSGGTSTQRTFQVTETGSGSSIVNTACATATGGYEDCSTITTTIRPPTPQIAINPASLANSQAPAVQTQQTLTISNTGKADLIWTLKEESRQPAVPLMTADEETVAVQPPPSPMEDPAIESTPEQTELDAGNKVLAPMAMTSIYNLILDDGIRDTGYAWSANTWTYANLFTPPSADFPFVLEDVRILHRGTGIDVGELITVSVYADTDGDPDTNNATLLRSLPNEQIQANDGSTFSVYPLSPPLVLNGPGDVVIAFTKTSPGGESTAVDTTTPQGHSYLSNDITNPTKWTDPDIPNINWMIRGYGRTAEACDSPQAISWASLSSAGGTTTPDSGSGVIVTFDSTGQAVGEYTSLLCLNSNDPVTPLIQVPLTMTVTTDPINVDDDFTVATPGWGVSAFDNILDGVTAAGIGGTVNVADGTYAETVNLNKQINVILNGNVTINGSVNLTDGVFASTSGNLSLTGDFSRSSGNTFNANSGMVSFISGATQNLVLNAPTTFNNITVAAGTELEETMAADNVTIAGTMSNNGITRKSQAISGNATYNFGITGGEIQVIDDGGNTLTSIQLDSVDSVHPNASGTHLETGRYWTITAPGASGFNVTLTLPVTFVPDTDGSDKLCRYTAEVGDPHPFECGQDSENVGNVGAQTITRSNVTAFSTWTAGQDTNPTAVTIKDIKANQQGIPLVGILFWVFLALSMVTLIYRSRSRQNISEG